MFVKLFGSILDSSVWAEDHATVRVWITMLVMAGPDGVVRAADSGICHRARVNKDEGTAAMKILSDPDLESKSQEYGGRRIERVEGGWLILNYKKYREIRTEQQVRDAARQQRHRQKGRDTSRDGGVTPPPVTPEAEGEAEQDAEAEAGSTPDGGGSCSGGAGDVAPVSPLSGSLSPTGGNGNGKLPARKGNDHVAIREHLASILGEVQDGRHQRLKADQIRTVQAELIFAYWQAEYGHERALLDDKRLNRLKRCLKENGGNVHELLWAVKGWRYDPTFRRLSEQDGRTLDGIQNIFTDRERIERLANNCKKWREEQAPHPMAVKYLEGLQP